QVDSGALTNRADVAKYFLGSVLSGGSSDPAAGNSPAAWLALTEEFYAAARHTRLQIPLIYGIDAVHGHNNIDGAVIFPHHIGLGATHDPALVQRAERVTAEEVAGTGIRWAFAPCIAVPQNPRWGRTYEGYGDEPGLVSELGVAATLGLQGDHLGPQATSVLACAKHFIGDGGTTNGVDQGKSYGDDATLRQLYLPPYVAAVRAGVGSIMVSYSSWNDVKMHDHHQLLTDVLKGELGFRGFLVSDWAAIDQIDPGNYKDCVARAINAGVDMVMIPYAPPKKNNFVEFINDLTTLVAEGKVSPARIDDAVRRILRIKFEMGLFQAGPTDPQLTAAIGSPAHRAVARQCVQESMVLLKNDHQVLPLSPRIKKLAVVGPGADDLGWQCGGWTIDWQGRTGQATSGGTTLLSAIKQTVATGTEVTYSHDGLNLGTPDAVIVVVSEHPYAEMKGDRQKLELSGDNQALVQRAQAPGVPVVTILYSGRPLILGDALKQSQAMVAAWLPGTEGAGLADVLFGQAKFTGKLPRIWPADDQHLRSHDAAAIPLFPAGYGLTD
ncbi:MAG TPA: glycoside hydrolase family 3 N-terminal domain-containing protein, partial [Verrucomicrobiae bacterium]